MMAVDARFQGPEEDGRHDHVSLMVLPCGVVLGTSQSDKFDGGNPSVVFPAHEFL